MARNRRSTSEKHYGSHSRHKATRPKKEPKLRLPFSVILQQAKEKRQQELGNKLAVAHTAFLAKIKISVFGPGHLSSLVDAIRAHPALRTDPRLQIDAATLTLLVKKGYLTEEQRATIVGLSSTHDSPKDNKYNIGMIGDGNASSTGDDNEDSGDPVKIEETSESGFDVDDLPKDLVEQGPKGNDIDSCQHL